MLGADLRALLEAAASNGGELSVIAPDVPKQVYPGIAQATEMGLLKKTSVQFDDMEIWQLTDAGYSELGMPSPERPSLWRAFASVFRR